MNWYYVDGGEQTGPVSDEGLAELQRAGKVTWETLVWREGMANWSPLRGTSSTSGAAPAMESAHSAGDKPGAVCSECGRLFDIQEMIRHGDAYVCADCKPIFIRKLSEGVQSDGAMAYAGFWVRFAAKFVDGLILGIPFLLVYSAAIYHSMRSPRPEEFGLLPLMVQFGFMIVQMIYQIVFVGRYGATPGKMLCKLRIVTADGGKVSYARATARFFAEMISGIVCYIGYIMVAFDSEKRGLHDHICSTRVIPAGT